MERTMTNEEKANEIALKYAREYLVSKNDSHKQNILFKESSIIECEKASLEMAKWKDEDFAKEKQSLIDKACEWLEHNVWEYTGFDSYELSEAFKNAMKGE